ncbi:MAG: hypothetical protein KAW67_01700, partial [Candidatus Eisenbacteria sp.]|nr:hypothetical protein [Candidatus Eisenbacteria bacterium]
NMYRLRSERAVEVRRKLRHLALVVFLVGVSIVVSGFFIFAVLLTEQDIAGKTARIEMANAELMEAMGGAGDAISDEELSLIRTRAVQTRWSNILAASSRLAIPELWVTQLRFSAGSLVGARGRTQGFHLEGRLRARRKEEGLAKLMEFLAVVRDEPVFVESFAEVKLVTSKWKQTMDDEYLEFEIFCPLGDQ